MKYSRKIMSVFVAFILGFSSFGCQKAVEPEVAIEKLLSEEIHYDQNGNVVDTHTYSYDGAGNATSKTNSRGTQNYTYEEGRVMSWSDGISMKTYHYNDKKQLVEVISEDVGEVVRVMKYEYDRAGNLNKMITQQPERADTEALYTYNANNEVIESNLELEGSVYKTTFEYDTNGNCIKETSFIDGEIDREVTSVYENNIMITQKQEVKAVEMVVDIKFEYNEANQVVKELLSLDGDPYYTAIEYIYE